MIDFNELSINVDECKNYREFTDDSLGQIDTSTENLLVETAEQMNSTANGVGRKAGKRYLLHYELGKDAEEISEIEDVSSKTVKNQTGRVKTHVLNDIDLALAVSNFRSSRSRIEKPDLPDGFKIADTVEIERGELSVSIEYKEGAPNTFYTWCYAGKSVFQEGEYKYILRTDFKINKSLGVLLKQTRRGVKKQDWDRPPAYSRYSDYDIYPLPHSSFPSEPDNTSIHAISNHLVWDVMEIPFSKSDRNDKSAGPSGYNSGDWEPGTVATSDISTQNRSPEVYATYPAESIHNLIEFGAGPSTIERYVQCKKEQRLLEKLLGMYPLNNPTEVPTETWGKIFDKSKSDINKPKTIEWFQITPRVGAHRVSDGGIHKQTR